MDRVLGGKEIVAEISIPDDAGLRTRVSSPYPKFLFVLFLLTLPLVNPWVRGDGVGYYAYLRSTLIDHDLRFEKDWLSANQTFIMSRLDAQGSLLPQTYTKTGYVENHFTVGPAILWAPVLIPVHMAILTLNHLGSGISANGYSRPYLVSMALTTAFYGFLSLILAFRTGLKYFDQQWVFLATIAIWLASSLPVYMYFNPSWSHALSAFSVALFIWFWDLTKMQRTVGQWAILGLIAGLMGNIYYPNVFVLVFPGLEVIYLAVVGRDYASRRQAFVKLAFFCAVFGTVFLLSLIPTFVTRQIIYGNPFATGYPGLATWNWTSPSFSSVLFSSDHGVWSWTPVLFFAVIGLIFLAKRNFLLGTASIVTVLLYYYFISSYPTWDGLSSYGNRFFVSLTPIFILGLAALFSAFTNWIGTNSRATAISGAAVALLVIWNAGFMFQWGTHLVPARGGISWSEMVHNQFVVVPARMKQGLETYFLHRKDMMQQIEQEDIEQQKSEKAQEN